VSYTDGAGFQESVLSQATVAVSAAPSNNPAVGAPTIAGTPLAGETLTADAGPISDANGLGTFSYQWFADNSEIQGQAGSTLVLTSAQVGKVIKVRVSYTDGAGFQESVSSLATVAVSEAPNNHPPEGWVEIRNESSGSFVEGETLTAITYMLWDPDGLDTYSYPFSYQWYGDGSPIGGQTASSTLYLTSGEVGKVITVRVFYTDDLGFQESVLSLATNAISAASGDAPKPQTDGVTIFEFDFEDDTLFADTSSLGDADGLGIEGYVDLTNVDTLSNFEVIELDNEFPTALEPGAANTLNFIVDNSLDSILSDGSKDIIIEGTPDGTVIPDGQDLGDIVGSSMPVGITSDFSGADYFSNDESYIKFTTTNLDLYIHDNLVDSDPIV
jgi:hypothetical protein